MYNTHDGESIFLNASESVECVSTDNGFNFKCIHLLGQILCVFDIKKITNCLQMNEELHATHLDTSVPAYISSQLKQLINHQR